MLARIPSTGCGRVGRGPSRIRLWPLSLSLSLLLLLLLLLCWCLTVSSTRWSLPLSLPLSLCGLLLRRLLSKALWTKGATWRPTGEPHHRRVPPLISPLAVTRVIRIVGISLIWVHVLGCGCCDTCPLLLLALAGGGCCRGSCSTLSLSVTLLRHRSVLLLLLHGHGVREATSLVIHVGVLTSRYVRVRPVPPLGLIITSSLRVVGIWHNGLSVEVLTSIVRGAVVGVHVVVGHPRRWAVLQRLGSSCWDLLNLTLCLC